MATAPKKLPPWMDKAEKKKGKVPKEPMKMMGKEKMMAGKMKKGGC